MLTGLRLFGHQHPQQSFEAIDAQFDELVDGIRLHNSPKVNLAHSLHTDHTVGDPTRVSGHNVLKKQPNLDSDLIMIYVVSRDSVIKKSVFYIDQNKHVAKYKKLTSWCIDSGWLRNPDE